MLEEENYGRKAGVQYELEEWREAVGERGLKRRRGEFGLVFALLPCSVGQVAAGLCALPCRLYPLIGLISPLTLPSSSWTNTHSRTLSLVAFSQSPQAVVLRTQRALQC